MTSTRKTTKQIQNEDGSVTTMTTIREVAKREPSAYAQFSKHYYESIWKANEMGLFKEMLQSNEFKEAWVVEKAKQGKKVAPAAVQKKKKDESPPVVKEKAPRKKRIAQPKIADVEEEPVSLDELKELVKVSKAVNAKAKPVMKRSRVQIHDDLE